MINMNEIIQISYSQDQTQALNLPSQEIQGCEEKTRQQNRGSLRLILLVKPL